MNGVFARRTIAAAGGLLLVGVGGAAVAEELVVEGGVDVTVEIEHLGEDGVLAMTVDGTQTSLTEVSSGDPAVRQFDGQLPTVTVIDTRTADEIPDGAFWYVVGSASAFIGDDGQEPISPGHLGWVPTLDDPEQEGVVAPGDQVDTVLDEGPNNVGLVDQELLAMALTSEDAIGTWTATADLFLKTPITTAPGSYSSLLTLSLFE